MKDKMYVGKRKNKVGIYSGNAKLFTVGKTIFQRMNGGKNQKGKILLI